MLKQSKCLTKGVVTAKVTDCSTKDQVNKENNVEKNVNVSILKEEDSQTNNSQQIS